MTKEEAVAKAISHAIQAENDLSYALQLSEHHDWENRINLRVVVGELWCWVAEVIESPKTELDKEVERRLHDLRTRQVARLEAGPSDL